MSKYNCHSCGGTGLYKGLCEPQGCAVVCVKCNGSGETDQTNPYGKSIPFTGRVIRTDIQRVYRGGGTMIFFGAGPKGNGISYQEFLNGTMPS